MVGRLTMLAIALQVWRRRRTAMAAAMLRALAVCPAAKPPMAAAPGRTPDRRYEGMAECMANRESPMDGLR